ncbi:FxsA family protein [Agaribacterium haliotis]|uniref:FxsA family protein n=1 Tax=Agaribacterium haliotis TaxID=2013869 RepID=UPI00195DE0F5|nr:FxsA family protein [Agaribacterium haliotis]
MQIFLVLFIVAPLIELFVMFEVSGVIGGLPTVALVVLTALIGVTLIRIQGFSTLMSAQQKMTRGEPPARELLEGLCLAVAGFMLLVPGFISDTLGFLLLVPGLRLALIRRLLRPVQYRYQSHAGENIDGKSKGRTIDGESWRE